MQPQKLKTSTPKPSIIPANKTVKSNKSILIIAGLIFTGFLIFGVIIFAALAFLVIKMPKEEAEFVRLINVSVVGNEKPEVFWVDNNTNSDPGFISDLESLRKVVDTGGFDVVAPYGECKIIKNRHRYSTEDSAEFCVASLCNRANNLNCIYIVGYSNNHGKNSTLRSFMLFETKEKVDAEIMSLLSY